MALLAAQCSKLNGQKDTFDLTQYRHPGFQPWIPTYPATPSTASSSPSPKLSPKSDISVPAAFSVKTEFGYPTYPVSSAQMMLQANGTTYGGPASIGMYGAAQSSMHSQHPCPPTSTTTTTQLSALTSAIGNQWWDVGMWQNDAYPSHVHPSTHMPTHPPNHTHAPHIPSTTLTNVSSSSISNNISDRIAYSSPISKSLPKPTPRSTSTSNIGTPLKSKRYTKPQCDCPNCQEADRLELERGPNSQPDLKRTSHNCHIPGCGKVSIII